MPLSVQRKQRRRNVPRRKCVTARQVSRRPISISKSRVNRTNQRGRGRKASAKGRRRCRSGTKTPYRVSKCTRKQSGTRRKGVGGNLMRLMRTINQHTKFQPYTSKTTPTFENLVPVGVNTSKLPLKVGNWAQFGDGFKCVLGKLSDGIFLTSSLYTTTTSHVVKRMFVDSTSIESYYIGQNLADALFTSDQFQGAYKERPFQNIEGTNYVNGDIVINVLSVPPLKAGWSKEIHSDGQTTFYVNQKTGESTAYKQQATENPVLLSGIITSLYPNPIVGYRDCYVIDIQGNQVTYVVCKRNTRTVDYKGYGQHVNSFTYGNWLSKNTTLHSCFLLLDTQSIDPTKTKSFDCLLGAQYAEKTSKLPPGLHTPESMSELREGDWYAVQRSKGHWEYGYVVESTPDLAVFLISNDGVLSECVYTYQLQRVRRINTRTMRIVTDGTKSRCMPAKIRQSNNNTTPTIYPAPYAGPGTIYEYNPQSDITHTIIGITDDGDPKTVTFKGTPEELEEIDRNMPTFVTDENTTQEDIASGMQYLPSFLEWTTACICNMKQHIDNAKRITDILQFGASSTTGLFYKEHSVRLYTDSRSTQQPVYWCAGTFSNNRMDLIRRTSIDDKQIVVFLLSEPKQQKKPDGPITSGRQDNSSEQWIYVYAPVDELINANMMTLTSPYAVEYIKHVAKQRLEQGVHSHVEYHEKQREKMLNVGTWVKAHDLKARPELNGMFGLITRNNQGRFDVEFHSINQTLAIKPEKLIELFGEEKVDALAHQKEAGEKARKEAEEKARKEAEAFFASKEAEGQGQGQSRETNTAVSENLEEYRNMTEIDIAMKMINNLPDEGGRRKNFRNCVKIVLHPNKFKDTFNRTIAEKLSKIANAVSQELDENDAWGKTPDEIKKHIQHLHNQGEL